MSGHPDPLAGAHGTGVELEGLSLYSATLLTRGRRDGTVRRWLMGLTLVAVAALFLPWQQNVQGRGAVTALRPEDRPQDVQTTIAGRIEQWYVQEGQRVKKGDVLLRISEVKEKYLDPNIVGRLAEQVGGKQSAIGQKRQKVAAMDALIAALEQSQRLKLDQTRNKVELYQAAYEAAVADSQVAADQVRRREALRDSGLVSLNDLQGFRLKAQSASAKAVEKFRELENTRIELNSVVAEYGEKIAKARADRDQTQAEIGEGSAEVAKLQNEYAATAKRADFYEINAPQDGIVVRAARVGIGEQVKEGETVVSLRPSAPSIAAEIYVTANDVPLLRRGRHVRLHFDGWPALQFSGWPQTMVGTFGGVVAVIDQVESKGGKFRVLVTPDPADKPWPDQLRMGSGVYGWAMLDEVRVWYELWRQLNAFPPSIDPNDAEPGADKGAAKKGK